MDDLIIYYSSSFRSCNFNPKVTDNKINSYWFDNSVIYVDMIVVWNYSIQCLIPNDVFKK